MTAPDPGPGTAGRAPAAVTTYRAFLGEILHPLVSGPVLGHLRHRDRGLVVRDLLLTPS
jgi:hypothetical protein